MSQRRGVACSYHFTEDSFDKNFPLLSRTYILSSKNKAFLPNMISSSIYASCLDGTDPGVRLDWYMAEAGNPGGWVVQYCYPLYQMRDAEAVARASREEQGDGTVCYFFGDTCIHVREEEQYGHVSLVPLGGNQTACGEWADLSIDQVYGYCTLLAKHHPGHGNPTHFR